MSSHHPIEQFLLDLDGAWGGAEPRIRLRMLGSAALMLQADYLRGTKDADVLGVEPVRGEIHEKLRRLAGIGSPLHAEHCSTWMWWLPDCPSCPTRHDSFPWPR